MIILGIDPGISGGVVRLDTEACTLAAIDMPVEPSTKGRSLTSALLLTNLMETAGADYLILEEVGVRPAEGAVGAFSFGRGFGRIEGVAAGAKINLWPVKPAEWKRVTQTPADKSRAVARAFQLFPHCTGIFLGPRKGIKDGRAEAALLAFYGALKLGCVPKFPITPVEFPT